MQLFGTSFNLDVGSFRLRISFSFEDRSEATPIRLEDMPRLEITKT